MPRLLLGSTWFDPVSAASMYEKDYEAAILANSFALFPNFICVEFKARVDSEYGVGQPDLALIDVQYRKWYVVEVELETHSFTGHVEEQVRKFQSGRYHEGHAAALARQDNRLDLSRLEDMMRGEQPQVCVIVTSSATDWAPRLRRYDAILTVVEVFRDEALRHILRVNGEAPSAMPVEVLSLCEPDPFFPNALKLYSPASFSALRLVDLYIDGGKTTWTVVRAKETAWLVPLRRAPVDASWSSPMSIEIEPSQHTMHLREGSNRGN